MLTTIALSSEERKLLVSHLRTHIAHLDVELVRTEKHSLAHALAREIEQLQSIEDGP